MLFAMFLIFWSRFWAAMTRPLRRSAEVIYLDQWRIDHCPGSAA